MSEQATSLANLTLPALTDWRFEIDLEGLAWAILDRAGESQNALSRRVLEELGEIVTLVETEASASKIKGLVFISGKPGGFIVGADIREFEDFKSEKAVAEAVQQVTALLDRIEALPIPTVAAIHGYCLGGGLELAMACQYRIATRDEGTRIGLPEIKLGIFPGFNGTVRAIKLAGPVSAMQAMLTGSMLRATVARGMGLVDELVPSKHHLRWSARKAALRNRKSRAPGFVKRLMTYAPIRGYLAGQMRQKTREKVREDHYPAPFRLIELFERHGGEPDRMKREETRAFAPLMISETAQNLRRVFRLSEMMKALAPKGSFKPLRAHVIGAGTMGADIAAWCVISGLEVSLQDLNEEQLKRAVEQAKALFRKRFKTPVEIDAAMTRLLVDPDGTNVPRADVIIEAVVERLDVKQKIFAEVERRAKPEAVIASNTSSLPIEDIAKAMTDPTRLIGLHFFNPVPQLPLVEVVKAPDTGQGWVEKGCSVVTAIGKFPLIVKSVPGFLVNRVLAPYMMEAMRRHEEGMERERIDDAAKVFGMPVGPLELADQVGLDICKHVAEILGLAQAEMAASRLARLVADGKLGKKSGEGFYVWKDGKAQRNAPKEPFPETELQALGEELVKPLIDECERCVAERVVGGADLADAGVIFGTGFAPFRGGPLHYRQTEREKAAAQRVLTDKREEKA
ncbi:MAG: 3-hydroxyacyl-CoA dehydrogenase NAD-binding domain-containing protein [Hyphomicrobiaceae bacterium]